MIYALVHAPDIYAPEELNNNPLYSSLLLSTIKSWMRNCVILVDNQNRIMRRVRLYLDSMQPQDRKEFQVCMEKLAKRNRIIERDINIAQQKDTDNDFMVCQEIVRRHLPDAFIVATKNSIALDDQADRCHEKMIALCEWAASPLFNKIERHDFKIGAEHDYTVLKEVLRYARHVTLFDRNIGRYWGEDYRQSLKYLFELYRDIGKFSKEGQFEIVTGLVENKEEEKKKNQEKYLDLVHFGKQMEREYPFQVTFIIKREFSYKTLSHPRYLRTEQFLIQLDAGFKFFNVAKGKTRPNILSVKDLEFFFEYDYLGLPDYETGNSKALVRSPFRNPRSENE